MAEILFSFAVCLSVCLSVSSLLQCLTLYSTHYRFVGHVFAAAGELFASLCHASASSLAVTVPWTHLRTIGDR